MTAERYSSDLSEAWSELASQQPNAETPIHQPLSQLFGGLSKGDLRGSLALWIRKPVGPPVHPANHVLRRRSPGKESNRWQLAGRPLLAVSQQWRVAAAVVAAARLSTTASH